jgi:RND family efflux transporter MFP subunit
VPVSLRAAKVEAVQRAVDVVGTLWADEDTTIASKVAGRVVAVHKDIGDRVGADEALVQVSPVDYELAKKQKELMAREPLAKLGLREMPAADFDTANVPTVKRAKWQADNAEAKYNRGRQLHEERPPLLSDQDFADLKTTWEVARSAYDVELLTAQSLLAQARTAAAEEELAKQRLADAEIRVPGGEAGGRKRSYAVAAKMVSVGEYLKEGAAVFRLIDDDIVKLRANVPERYVREVAMGQEVRVNVEAYEEEFVGRVARINPQVDPANRTFQIEVTIGNPKHVLKPGSFAKGRVLTRMDQRAVFVPQEAVVTFAGTSKVFTVSGGKAVEHVVELGETRGEFVETTSGLSGAETVVVDGASKLAAGVAVTVKGEGASRPATGGAARAGENQE